MIIETLVTIIFISLTVVIIAQIIAAQLAINGANTFHTNVVQAIEESDFESGVIETCILEAEQRGYDLDVSVDKYLRYSCGACNSTWELDDLAVCPNCQSTNIYEKQSNSDGIITLTYNIVIEMLGIEKVGSLQSNAR